MMRFTIVFVSVFATAACVGDPPTDGGGGGDNTGGDGGGGGGGGGDGSGSGSGTGGTGGTMTASKFLEEINKKFCDQSFTCKSSFPTDWGITFDEAFGTSASACYAQAAQDIPPAQVESQIAAGKITFNANDASTCLAGITFGTCNEFWQQGPQMPAACETVLLGTVADGGACVTHIDCTNFYSYCDETTNTCTPDQSGARTVPSNQEPWHTQTPELLKLGL
jgi:hypothetical protein